MPIHCQWYSIQINTHYISYFVAYIHVTYLQSIWTLFIFIEHAENVAQAKMGDLIYLFPMPEAQS